MGTSCSKQTDELPSDPLTAVTMAQKKLTERDVVEASVHLQCFHSLVDGAQIEPGVSQTINEQLDLIVATAVKLKNESPSEKLEKLCAQLSGLPSEYARTVPGEDGTPKAPVGDQITQWFKNVVDSIDLPDMSLSKALFSPEMVDALQNISDLLQQLKKGSEIKSHEFGAYLFAFACLQDISPPPLSVHPLVAVPDSEINKRLSEVRKYVKFSSAAYGRHFLRLTGVAKITDPIYTSDEKTAAHHCGIPVADIILCDWKQSLFRPAYFLSIDHTSKAIVLALRGTNSFHDALTDLCCECSDVQSPFDPTKRHRAHRGMVEGAAQISDLLLTKIKSLSITHSDYSVVITGHSLGGGVAALLTAMWLNNFPWLDSATFSADPARPVNTRIHTYTFGCPAVTDPELCRQLIPYITAVVTPFDMVPTLGFAPVADLMDAMHHIKSEKLIVTAIRAKTKLSASRSKKNSSSENLSEMNEKVWSDSVMARIREKRVEEEEAASIRMYPPGLIFGFSQIGEKTDSWSFVRKDCLDFGEIIFNSKMVANHMPNVYEKLTLSASVPTPEQIS